MTTLPPTYKALVYEKYGPIDEVLRLRDMPMEPLPAMAVRVRIHYAALNPADYLIAEGAGEHLLQTSPSAEVPHRVGFDAVGVIVEVGSQVGSNFQVGDEVYFMTPFKCMASVAEYITVDAACVAHKPKTVDLAKAAAVPAVSLTGYQSLVEIAKLQKGERILVLGGSTSVGMYAIQHAKILGAHVIATASTQKTAFLKTIGADEVIDYTTTTWSDVVVPHSLDVVLECVGDAPSWDKAAQLVMKKEGSRFVTVIPGPPASAPKFGATHSTVFCHESGTQLAEIAAFIDSGKLQPVVDSVFPFEKAVEAMALVKTRRVLGKVVIQIQ